MREAFPELRDVNEKTPGIDIRKEFRLFPFDCSSLDFGPIVDAELAGFRAIDLRLALAVVDVCAVVGEGRLRDLALGADRSW